jgi:methylphosphotriester-DNA--protein-cysteine methyltransferase
MLSSTTGVFRESGELQAAMREYGCTNLIVTGRGSFRAHVTRFALHRLRLLSADESLARIATFTIPDDAILVAIPLGEDLQLIWGSTAVRTGEIVTLGAGHRFYTRSTSRCRWGAILLPIRLALSYSPTIIGEALVLSSGTRSWRPSAEVFRHLIRLHIRATRVANAQAGVITTSEPARTLEQELIAAVISCLSGQPADSGSDAKARHSDVMARFDVLLQTYPTRPLTSDELCAALDVSERTLRACCAQHLGMGPVSYMRLRRMQLVHRALSRADPAIAKVSQIAAQHGFSQIGRFAGTYRAQFGELPSVTLRRSSGQ